MSTQPQYHPTNDLRKENYSFGSGKIKFFDITPPIEEVVLDNTEVNKSFTELPIVPYAGDEKVTSHRMVSVLYYFRDMSTTYAAILNKLKSYALGMKMEIKKVESTIFDIADEVTIGNNEQRKFDDFIRANFIFHSCDLLDLCYNLFDSYDSTGQVGVEIIRKTILGKTTITFKFHEPMDYVFLYGKTMGNEVAISRRWDFEYLKKNTPLIVPLFPNWEKHRDGYERTFYFRRNGSQLYGRPNDLSCLSDKYNEHKLKQFLTKLNKKLWLPGFLLETQDSKGGFNNEQEAQNKGYASSKHRLEQNFTSEGEGASTFIVTNRAPDSAPTEVHEFPSALKNSKDVAGYRRMFKEAICEANDFPIALLDMIGATGISTNVFLDIFSITEVTKIYEVQTITEKMVNDLLHIGFGAMGSETDLGIMFNSPLKELMNEYRNSKGGNIEQPGREGNTVKA